MQAAKQPWWRLLGRDCPGMPLVGQWLRIYLPMQGTWVPSLVQELRSHMLGSN